MGLNDDILKVKHCKLSLDFVFDATVLNNGFCCFCMYPQGVTVNLDYLYYILNGLWDGEIFQMMLVQVTMKLCSLRVFQEI